MKNLWYLLILACFPVVLFAQSETNITDGNNTIHVTSFGTGQPLLIINGGPGMHSAGFKPLAAILGKTHQAIIYDQRGTGQSTITPINQETITLDAMVEDIETIRKYFKIDRWIILGHSFGGMLGSYYAAKHPERVKGLILSSSGGINMELFSRLRITDRLSPTNRDSLQYWTNRLLQGDTSYFVRLKRGTFLAPAYLYDQSHVPVVADRLTQSNRTINSMVFQNMQAINFDCSKGLKQLQAPVLIIQGAEDLIDRQTAETAMNVLPHASLVILEKCGHYGWLDQPQLYFKHLQDYLDKLDT